MLNPCNPEAFRPETGMENKRTGPRFHGNRFQPAAGFFRAAFRDGANMVIVPILFEVGYFRSVVFYGLTFISSCGFFWSDLFFF
jgi:hypothetical protein